MVNYCELFCANVLLLPSSPFTGNVFFRLCLHVFLDVSCDPRVEPLAGLTIINSILYGWNFHLPQLSVEKRQLLSPVELRHCFPFDFLPVYGVLTLPWVLLSFRQFAGNEIIFRLNALVPRCVLWRRILAIGYLIMNAGVNHIETRLNCAQSHQRDVVRRCRHKHLKRGWQESVQARLNNLSLKRLRERLIILIN